MITKRLTPKKAMNKRDKKKKKGTKNHFYSYKNKKICNNKKNHYLCNKKNYKETAIILYDKKTIKHYIWKDKALYYLFLQEVQ